MDFDDWLKIGRDNAWVSATVCDTHEGLPMSEAEVKELEENDPCIHALRLYESKEQKIEVEGE